MVCDKSLLNGKEVKASAELNKKADYRCLDCHEPLILRVGPIRTAHFAHRPGSICERNSEPETFAHTAMKDDLQKLLNIPDEYREFRGIPGVQPDLVWQGRFAIEVQHSRIQTEEVKRRNAKYFNNGFIPIWILHRQEMEGNNYYERGFFLADHFPEQYFIEQYILTTKLKDFEQYILQCQGALCYIAFDNDYRSDEPLFGYEEFEKVRGRKTLYIAKSVFQNRNFMFHSAAEFEAWTLDYPGGRKREREEEERKAKLRAQEQEEREAQEQDERERSEREAKERAWREKWRREEVLEAQKQELILRAQQERWEREAKLRAQKKEEVEREAMLKVKEQEERRQQAALKAKEQEKEEQKARLREKEQEDERIYNLWLEIKGYKSFHKDLDKSKQLRVENYI